MRKTKEKKKLSSIEATRMTFGKINGGPIGKAQSRNQMTK